MNYPSYESIDARPDPSQIGGLGREWWQKEGIGWIRLLDHPFSTTGPLTVTGFGRTGISCDADTENVM